MAIPRLYCPTLVTGQVELPDSEVHHATASLRLGRGDHVQVFDGEGREAGGMVSEIGRHRLIVDTEEIRVFPFDFPRRITVAVAMPKTHRQGYLIEKCTELGAAAVWPIVTGRSVAKVGPRSAERWQARAIEACKQSRRRWIPQVSPPRTLEESLLLIAGFDLAGLADTVPEAVSIRDWVDRLPAYGTAIVWIGPEGGWTDSERQAACRAGATVVTLGPTVLRSETAAAAVCAVVSAMSARS